MTAVQWTDVYPDGPGSAAGGSGITPEAAGNPDYPGMPAGATPIHHDLSLAAATTAAGTALWTPSVGSRFVLTSALISTDTAGRIALIDDTDNAGNRIGVLRAGANGGASPNLVPVPYVSKATGNVLRVVSNVVGNVDISIRGWEQASY